MSKGINEKRRELIQTLLIVGGIVGGLVSGRQSSIEVFHTAVLQFLIIFVFGAVLVYSLLMSESKEHSTGYNIAAFFVALAFSLMLFASVMDVIGNSGQAFATLIAGTSVITFALIYDWEKTKSNRPKEGLMCWDRKKAEEAAIKCAETSVKELNFLNTTTEDLITRKITLDEYVKILRDKGIGNPMDRAYELHEQVKEFNKCPCSGCISGYHPPSKVKGQIVDFGRECETCEGKGQIFDLSKI